MIEYGIFNDEGLLEGGFYSVEAVERGMKYPEYLEEPFIYWDEICPDHEEQPQEHCEECWAE